MMKKVLMIGLMAGVMCLAAGCGAKREEETNAYGMTSGMEESDGTADAVTQSETVPEKQSTEETNGTADTSSDAEIMLEKQSAEETGRMTDAVSDTGIILEKQGAEESTERERGQELNGIVTEIVENRVTIITGGEYREDREGQANTPGEVDVYVDDSTVYELQELRNGGADVKRRESSFDEIQKDESMLRVTGHWKGADFYAEKIVNNKLAN